MNLSRRIFAMAMFSVVALRAAEWPPIAPEVWALKEDPARGIKDAVILEDRTIFHCGNVQFSFMERKLRIRVLSEAGRKAAHLGEFSEECSKFNGRTVYPDGKVVTFDKRQDFRQEEATFGLLSQKRTMLVPPGVTGNCVVELQWIERADPLPGRLGNHAQWRFGGPYLTLLETIEIPLAFPWAYAAIHGRTQKLEMEEKDGFKVFSARSIPAFEQPPYSLTPSIDRPVFMAYYQPRSLSSKMGKDVKAYWDALGPLFWKDSFETVIQKGANYRAFKDRILPKIQGKSPQASALELLTLLNQEILNGNDLTAAEFAKWPKKQLLPNSDLDEMCKKGFASQSGMRNLYYHLLKDLGITPKIALLADRSERLFNPKFFNAWQLSGLMIAIEEPGKPLALMDPASRFTPAGMIYPDYQGVQGLLLDPKAGWASETFMVPVQSPDFNRKHYEYSLSLGEEEDRFQVEARFSGFPDFAERGRYRGSEPVEQNRSLKERFEQALKGASIGKAEVLNAISPKEAISWKTEGTLEPQPGRTRQIDPFPGMPWPLWVPDAFPKERTLAIVMPYLQAHLSRSTIKVPKGFRLRLAEPLRNKNRFGRVAWSMELKTSGEESIAEITLDVSVDAMFSTPGAYEDLKAFLGWVSDACRRTLILERA